MPKTYLITDLECTSTKQTAGILSIGAVAVTYAEGVVRTPFYGVCKLSDLESRSDVFDVWCDSTKRFWEADPSHSPLSKVVLNDDRGVSLPVLLEQFASYVKSLGDDVVVVGKGTKFDFGILSHAYDSLGIPRPWNFRKTNCLRAVIDNAEELGVGRGMKFTPYVPHHALFDAVSEAVQFLYLQNLILSVVPDETLSKLLTLDFTRESWFANEVGELRRQLSA